MQQIHAELDAVLEIGAGIGDSIAEAASRNPHKDIEFFGGEIALNGLKCIAEFADMLGLKNLHGIDFNIVDPHFGFLKGKRNVLVYSQFAMVYVNPFPYRFFEKLLDAAENVTALLFEPFSFALAEEFRDIKPLFTRGRARDYGIAENFWDCIRRLRDEGRIVVEEVIPDIAGKNAFSTVSLVRFRKLR